MVGPAYSKNTVSHEMRYKAQCLMHKCTSHARTARRPIKEHDNSYQKSHSKSFLMIFIEFCLMFQSNSKVVGDRPNYLTCNGMISIRIVSLNINIFQWKHMLIIQIELEKFQGDEALHNAYKVSTACASIQVRFPQCSTRQKLFARTVTVTFSWDDQRNPLLKENATSLCKHKIDSLSSPRFIWSRLPEGPFSYQFCKTKTPKRHSKTPISMCTKQLTIIESNPWKVGITRRQAQSCSQKTPWKSN